MQIKKAYLIVAFVGVSIIALLYGIDPPWYASTFLGVTDLGVNFAHILRALMGLYLALACFWLYSAFSDAHRNTVVLTTIVFAAQETDIGHNVQWGAPDAVAADILAFVKTGAPTADLAHSGKAPNVSRILTEAGKATVMRLGE